MNDNIVVSRDDPLIAGQVVTLAVTTYYDVDVGEWLSNCSPEDGATSVTLEEIEDWLACSSRDYVSDERIAHEARRELDAGYSECDWSLGAGSSAVRFENRYEAEKRRQAEKASA